MIDTHVHMNEIDDVEQAIRKANEAGVKKIVAVGMDLDSNKKTLALAHQFPRIIYPAIGYHPWSITLYGIEENLAFIEENLTSCIALGEVGLDYKTKVKKQIQWEIFSRAISIAKEHNRPAIIHSRFSHKRTHQMVRESGVKKAVFHWYTGSLDILEDIIEDGYFISATPALAYSPPHQAAIKRAPLEQILVETDAPVEYQDKVSEPADLLVTLREISRLKGMETDEVSCITTANAERFFGI
jgi:TatD DNase family protein